MDKLLDNLIEAATAHYSGHDAQDQAKQQLLRMHEIALAHFKDNTHDESTRHEIWDVIKGINQAYDLTFVILSAKQLPCPFPVGSFLQNLPTAEHTKFVRSLLA